MICLCTHHWEDHSVIDAIGSRECDHADCNCTAYADEEEWACAADLWEQEQEAREYARL